MVEQHRNRNRVRGAVGIARVVVALLLVGLGIALGAWFARRGAPHDAGKPGAAQAASAELWTCSMHPQVLQSEPGLCPICHMALTPVSAAAAGGGLALDPVVVQTMGVRTVRVRTARLAHDVRVGGRLVERTPDHRDVNLRVGGWIETLHAGTDGMRVMRGEPLFELSSPELTLAIGELIAARTRAESRPDDELARTLLAAARARLVQLGLSDEQIDELARLDAAPATIPFLAPSDGHVTAVEVYAGAAVEPGMRVLRLADNARLWLDLRVPERDLGRVRDGAAVTAEVDTYPGETFAGHVVFVHPHVDDATRTALVRAEIDNGMRRLREGQWARATIASDAEPEALVVPREALVETGRRTLAFVALGGGRFDPREVQAGAGGDDGLVAVLAGLDAGEEVVVSGQFLLDSESRLREAVRKRLEPGAAPAARSRPDWADGVDALVTAYLDVTDRLGREPAGDAPVDASALVAAARALETQSNADERVVAVLRAALPFSGADATSQREKLKRLSDAVLDLVDAVPPSARVAASLYLVSCPMAPGRWLQRDDVVRNPYYATTMKACGEVVRPVATVADDAKGRER